MRKIVAMLIITVAAQATGTGSYKIKMSDEQKIINISTYKNGYVNVRQIGTCGYMEILDKNNKKVITGSQYAPINKALIKGRYKLVIYPDKGDCTVNIIMPE